MEQKGVMRMDQRKAELLQLWDQAREPERAQMLVTLADAVDDMPPEHAAEVERARHTVAEAEQS
jgi:hypothetical protein